MRELTEGRSAREVLTWSRAQVGPALRAAVDLLPDSIGLIAGYHFGWWDGQGKPTEASGGKAIRPALVLLAAEAVGSPPEAAVPAAVAVELAHNFSLLHDDVMDGDVTRRHRPTAWSVFGANAAILAGDALLTLAFDVLAAGGGPAASTGLRVLSGTVLDLLAGQRADLAFEERSDVRLEECLSMAELKTGALLGCSSALGALAGGAEPERVAEMRAFGARLGLAFQFVDDLLGIWGEPSVTGKPAHSDLRNRKKSLPVVAALTSGTPAGRELDELIHRSEPPAGGELAHAARLVDLAGGRAWSQAQADDLVDQALRHLWGADPVARSAAELSALARMVTHRDH